MKKLFWIAVFAVSMGYLEATVVIYLRELFYPGAFSFPMKAMPPYLVMTEMGREAATILMIMGVAYLKGDNLQIRFAWFLFVFAVWDLTYYGVLKLILGWPSGVFTWDVLFLLPVVWVGPVLAPVILCFLMLLLWKIMDHFDLRGYLQVLKRDYLILIAGSLVILINFCLDYMRFVFRPGQAKSAVQLSLEYVPEDFNWWVFAFGCIVIGTGIFLIFSHNLKRLRSFKEAQFF